MEASSYDTRAPERLTVTMTRLNSAGQRLGAEVVEIELSNLRSGVQPETSSATADTFCTSELYRQVCNVSNYAIDLTGEDNGALQKW